MNKAGKQNRLLSHTPQGGIDLDSLEWYKYYLANEYGSKSAELKMAAVENIVKSIINEINTVPAALENSPFAMEVKEILDRKAELNYLNWARQAIDLMDASLIISSVWEVLQDSEYSVKVRRYDARSWVFDKNHLIMDQQQKTHEGILQKCLLNIQNWIKEKNKPAPPPPPAPSPTPPEPVAPTAPAAPVAAAAYRGTPAPAPRPTAPPTRPSAPARPVPGASSRAVPSRADSASADTTRPVTGATRPLPPRRGDDVSTPAAPARRSESARPTPGAAPTSRPPTPRPSATPSTPHRPGAAPARPTSPTSRPPARPTPGASSRTSAGATSTAPRRPAARTSPDANTDNNDMTARINNLQNDLQALANDMQSYGESLIRQAAMAQIELYNRIARVYEQHYNLAEASNNPDYVEAINSQQEYLTFIEERLTGLNIEKFSSRPGIPFDSRLHEPIGGGRPSPRGAVIKRSISPGFRYRDNVWQKEKVEI